eukprot:TRINITY_DN9950_c0_g1_i1.p1 TRINITY_DN9950_c0_g1~~TRINITY_DN9950_c0_g1_i1.p1  ORF type:complete len:567 (+),score=112.42 TRINITY_DN9950_c0_g1_i1:105-1703(+)
MAGVASAVAVACMPGAIRLYASGMFVPSSLGSMLLLLTLWTWTSVSVSRLSQLLCVGSYALLALTWQYHPVVLVVLSLHALNLSYTAVEQSQQLLSTAVGCLMALCLLPNVPGAALASLELLTTVVVLAIACMQARRWVTMAILLAVATIHLVVASQPLFSMTNLTSGDILTQLSSDSQSSAWGLTFAQLGALASLLPLGVRACMHPDETQAQPQALPIIGLFVTLLAASLRKNAMPLAIPFVSILVGIGMSSLVNKITGVVTKISNSKKARKADMPDDNMSINVSRGMLGLLLLAAVAGGYHLPSLFTRPDTFPSVVLRNGTRIAYDDVREACEWVRSNTNASNTKLFSWIDMHAPLHHHAQRPVLGYDQKNATTVVSNIAQIMISNEANAATRLRQLGVTHVVVTFGGVIGSTSDDIGKFLWMLRSAQLIDESIQESDYLSPTGGFRISGSAPDVVKDSLVYKLSYYDFAFKQTAVGKPRGWDRARKAEVGRRLIDLQQFAPAYTSTNWLVRVYEVLPEAGRDTRFLHLE